MRLKLVSRECPKDKLDLFCGYKIWEKPKEGIQYAIGADVAEGVGQDASCAQVINCRTGLHVATYWSNAIDVDAYSAELYKLANYYNRAQLCVEQNNHGNGVLALLGGAVGALHYPNLYRRFVLDEFTQKRTKQIGFRTTQSTKPRIIENLKAALRDGELLTLDKYTIKELNSFVRDIKTGKMGAKGKSRDDRVMALALAWESTRIIKETTAMTEENSAFSQEYDEMTGFPVY